MIVPHVEMNLTSAYDSFDKPMIVPFVEMDFTSAHDSFDEALSVMTYDG